MNETTDEHVDICGIACVSGMSDENKTAKKPMMC